MSVAKSARFPFSKSSVHIVLFTQKCMRGRLSQKAKDEKEHLNVLMARGWEVCMGLAFVERERLRFLGFFRLSF